MQRMEALIAEITQEIT